MNARTEMPASGTTVTAAELLSLGINPDCVLCSKRLVGMPLDVRFGDDRIERSSGGRISRWFGYYGSFQTTVRAKQHKMALELIQKNSVLNRLLEKSQ